MSKNNNEFKQELKKMTGKEIDLPNNVDFCWIEKEEKVKITLPTSAVSSNMQTDEAAFEGWAALIYVLLRKVKPNLTIEIDIKAENKNGEKWDIIGQKNVGHYNRFLYRLMKFENQCRKFIIISEDLKKHMGKVFIKKDDGTYRNFYDCELMANKPDEDAGCNGEPEAIIEKGISEKPSDILRKTETLFNIKMDNSLKLNRQLPVGVFIDNVAADNMIFTGGKSAIDLWGMSENDDICIYELKADDNKKIGIISELFFYANLIFDEFKSSTNFKKNNKGKKNSRGYQSLLDLEKANKVYAVFLVKELHKQLRDDNTIDDIISLLSNENIKYGTIHYDYNLKLSVK